jgi:hypothetical protein
MSDQFVTVDISVTPRAVWNARFEVQKVSNHRVAMDIPHGSKTAWNLLIRVQKVSGHRVALDIPRGTQRGLGPWHLPDSLFIRRSLLPCCSSPN